MISSALALALLAAPSPEAINRARIDFTKCVSAHVKKSLVDKLEADAYEAGLSAACGGKEQAYRSTAIAADTAVGIKRAEAEENAQFVVEDILTNAKETFVDFKATGAIPQ